MMSKEQGTRRQELVAVCLFLFGGAFGLESMAENAAGPDERPFFHIAAAVFVLFGMLLLWQAWQAARHPKPPPLPMGQRPIAEQVRTEWARFWCSLVIFPAVSVSVAHDLHRLESKAVKEVHTWAPIAMLYELFGYWPAVLLLPVLGLAVALAILRKIRKLRSK